MNNKTEKKKEKVRKIKEIICKRGSHFLAGLNTENPIYV